MPEQAAQLVGQPDVVRVGAGAVFNENGESAYRLNGKRVVLYGADADYVSLNRAAAFAGTYPQAENEVLLGKTAARVLHVGSGDTVTLTLPDGTEKPLTVTGVGGIDEDFYGEQYSIVDAYLPQEAFAALLTANGEALPQTHYELEYTSAARAAKALPKAAQPVRGDGCAGKPAGDGFGRAEQQYGFSDRVRDGSGAVRAGAAGRSADDLRQHEQQSGPAHPVLWHDALHRHEQTAGHPVRPAGSPQLVQDGGAHRPCAGHFGQLDDRAALRYGIGGEFAATPVWQLSPAGLCAGAVVGVVTVLLAAQAPAKRAAKVSPMAAVSGSTQNVPVGRAAHAGKGRVELALGVRHATASKKNWALMTASFALSIVLALGFTVLLQFASLLLPSLVPWQPDVLYNGYGNAQVLPGSMTRTLLEVPGVAHAWGCTGLVDTPASSDKGNVDHVIFCSYDDYMLESSRSVVVRGRMPGAGNEVMTIYNKNNPMRIGDVITVNGVPLTIVGAFSEGTFPDDVTLIAPEALFRQVAGDQNYNMVGVQLDRTADEDTLFTLADLATDDVIMQDLRESNRQDRGTYYAVRIVLYGFLAIIGGISLLNIVNSISMSVSARARQYGAMRAVGMEDVQLCRMIAAEAGTYAASGLLVGVAAGLVLHRALYTRLITHYFGVVWRVPFGLLAVLCLFVAGAAALTVHGPVKRLQAMPVTAAINEL